MGNFNLKSILLGIGIGIIITATVSMIYLAGRDPLKNLSEQDIKKIADQYGLVRNETDKSGGILQDGSIY